LIDSGTEFKEEFVNGRFEAEDGAVLEEWVDCFAAYTVEVV
jgi:hypothetical protein